MDGATEPRGSFCDSAGGIESQMAGSIITFTCLLDLQEAVTAAARRMKIENLTMASKVAAPHEIGYTN